MSAFHSDKCSKAEIHKFKDVVIQWLKDYGIDTSVLDIRAYTSYNGDIKIFTGDYFTFTNTKKSFRRTSADKNSNGDWDDFKNNIMGENKDCYDDYRKLEKLRGCKQ